MKKYLLIFLFATFFIQFGICQQPSQNSDENTVTLTVVGQGKTIEEARINALRSSIEQAFGTFVSTNTEVLNETLVKDEVATISNGNVQKYEIISETPLPDGTFSSTIKATVSISKLTSYCKSKGISVEFQGGLFAQNMAIQELYAKNEKTAWDNTRKIIENLMGSGFDYKLKISNPILLTESSYTINIEVIVSMNKNYKAAMNTLLDFGKSVSLSKEDAITYVESGKQVFPVTILDHQLSIKEAVKWPPKKSLGIFLIRNRDVANQILRTPWDFAEIILRKCKIVNQIDTLSINNYISKKRDITIEDIRNTYEYGLVYNSSLKKRWQLGGWTIDGGGFYNEIHYCDGCTRGIYQDDIFTEKSNQYSYEEPFDLLPVANFFGLEEFLKITISDIRTLEEIKKISEFKVITE